MTETQDAAVVRAGVWPRLCRWRHLRLAEAKRVVTVEAAVGVVRAVRRCLWRQLRRTAAQELLDAATAASVVVSQGSADLRVNGGRDWDAVAAVVREAEVEAEAEADWVVVETEVEAEKEAAEGERFAWPEPEPEPELVVERIVEPEARIRVVARVLVWAAAVARRAGLPCPRLSCPHSACCVATPSGLRRGGIGHRVGHLRNHEKRDDITMMGRAMLTRLGAHPLQSIFEVLRLDHACETTDLDWLKANLSGHSCSLNT